MCLVFHQSVYTYVHDITINVLFFVYKRWGESAPVNKVSTLSSSAYFIRSTIHRMPLLSWVPIRDIQYRLFWVPKFYTFCAALRLLTPSREHTGTSNVYNTVGSSWNTQYIVFNLSAQKINPTTCTKGMDKVVHSSIQWRLVEGQAITFVHYNTTMRLGFLTSFCSGDLRMFLREVVSSLFDKLWTRIYICR